jgi:hypothetical protein
MKFNLWRQYGAQNSSPVFDAFHAGANALGHDVVVNSNDGIDVIWSVLFNGRMGGNRAIWERCQREGRPCIVLEVGGIKRGTTWRVGLNGINRDAYFGPGGNDDTRAKKLNLKLEPWRKEGKFILVCGQHDKSLQWKNMPRMSNWVMDTIEGIQKHTNMPIYFRPHPRCRLEAIEHQYRNVYRQEPRHVMGTYDDFDMSFRNVHAIFCYSSNPGPQAIIAGIPAFVSKSSFAYDVGNDIDFFHDIKNPLMPDRTQWLNDYAWTEFTVQEISEGIPLKRLTNALESAIV